MQVNARCLRTDGAGLSLVGLGSQLVSMYSGCTLSGHRGKNDKNLFLCHVGRRVYSVWRGEVSQDLTRFRPKVVWAWLGASNPRQFAFYKDGIDGSCFLGRRKGSSNETQNKKIFLKMSRISLICWLFLFCFLKFLTPSVKETVRSELVWNDAVRSVDGHEPPAVSSFRLSLTVGAKGNPIRDWARCWDNCLSTFHPMQDSPNGQFLLWRT